MTHAELVARAQRWLRSSLKHPVVIAEMGLEAEKPDVLGWRVNGWSTLVECKTSRSDFLRDRDKHFRRDPERGMGFHRWYCAPPKLLAPRDLPEGWGLVEVDAKCMRVIAKPSRSFTARNIEGETRTLISALRRATEGWGRNVFGEISPAAGTIDPHPSVAKYIRELHKAERSEREKRQRRDERIAELEAELKAALASLDRHAAMLEEKRSR